ncbi:MAG TPA: ribonuclease R, partial [Afipia sp.]|nr:ribonuclease R [Afipia sp.]
MKKKSDATTAFPDRESIVAFVKAHPGEARTRDIARHFGLKNESRAELRRALRDLAEEGAIATEGRKVREPKSLPPTLVADITGRDSDGELLAAPAEWFAEVDGPAPAITIHVPRKPKPGTVAGVGDRVLLRVEKPRNKHETYSGRVIKLLDKTQHRVLGIYREMPNGDGRMIPVDKKQAGRD